MPADSPPINLTHHFLIAMPGLQDESFSRSVVYLCEHSPNGALGLIINKPSDINLKRLFEKVDLPLRRADLSEAVVFQGGPVQTERGFVLHEPLAAASIGQVHRARLDNGAEVVVKVQRPGIENVIAVDLEILAHIAELMERHLEEVQGHQPMAIVHEFARSLSREIDFSIELANIQRFTRQFEQNPTIHVPLVYPELSTDRVLVMEYVIGIKSSKV